MLVMLIAKNMMEIDQVSDVIITCQRQGKLYQFRMMLRLRLSIVLEVA
jgi:hypothetical protein